MIHCNGVLIMRYDEYVSGLQKAVVELDNAVQVLIQDVATLIDEYWVDVKAHDAFLPFAFNVQRQQNGYRIRWGELYKSKSTSGSSAGKVRMKHINKGKGDAYFLTQFKNHPVWFEVIFHKYESQLTEIRKAIRSNRKARKSISQSIAFYSK